MTTLTIDKHDSSAIRVKKHRENMIKMGFKRVQKWVFDIESTTIQQQMEQDLASYSQTSEEQEWNAFALNETNNLKDWK